MLGWTRDLRRGQIRTLVARNIIGHRAGGTPR